MPLFQTRLHSYPCLYRNTFENIVSEHVCVPQRPGSTLLTVVSSAPRLKTTIDVQSGKTRFYQHEGNGHRTERIRKVRRVKRRSYSPQLVLHSCSTTLVWSRSTGGGIDYQRMLPETWDIPSQEPRLDSAFKVIVVQSTYNEVIQPVTTPSISRSLDPNLSDWSPFITSRNSHPHHVTLSGPLFLPAKAVESQARRSPTSLQPSAQLKSPQTHRIETQMRTPPHDLPSWEAGRH